MNRMIKRMAIVSALALSAGMAFSAVTEHEAVDIALRDAGVAREETTWLNSHRDSDDGRTYYDIEFRSAEGKWDYEIESESGRITGFDFEESRHPVPQSQQGGQKPVPPAPAEIGRPDAERIALSDAGFERKDVSRFRIEMDHDDGIRLYEISFSADGYEYEYDVSIDDGTILKASWEKKGRIGGDRSARLSQADAEAIAMGVLPEGAEHLYVREDRDDGRFWYEADAASGDYRYDVDIAGTGEVVSVSRELVWY